MKPHSIENYPDNSITSNNEVEIKYDSNSEKRTIVDSNRNNQSKIAQINNKYKNKLPSPH